MRRPDHDPVDKVPRYVQMRQQLAKRGDDAARHVLGGGRLDRVHNRAVCEQHRVGIGPADIDPDPAHVSPWSRESSCSNGN
jgi:hypothetical protein